MTEGDLGLYIHVPFCRCKCVWCAFASEVGATQSGAWLDRIITQLGSPPVQGGSWSTVYIGGGTPTLLEPRQLDRLLGVVAQRTNSGAEMTLEANPESLTAEHLSVFARRGGTRLSLGIQTFHQDLLSRHGRSTRSHHLIAARKLLAKWSGQVSLDLICGLGGQTREGQVRDLELALEWNPDHVSWYSLTVESETPLARGVKRGTAGLPPDDESAQWWLEGRDRLEKAGLHQYEVSNFARPGAESLHNGRYWSLGHWWGVGPSAGSRLPLTEGRCEYRTEPFSLAAWLAGAEPEVEIPTRLEEVKNSLLAGLRRTAGVDSAPWVDLIPVTLGRWSERTTVAGGRLFLTRQAFPFLDAFLRDAFAELDERPEFR